MEKISQLMDGEFDEHEARRQIRRLELDASLVQAWATYHLIRDVLRHETGASSDLAGRLGQRLEHEPTVVAPHTRLPSRLARYSLPLAATVAGVTVVGWLAFTSQSHVDTVRPMAKNNPPAAMREALRPVLPVAALAGSQMDDYLRAHQEFSPTSAMQGVASYVRTVSNEDWDPSR
ncbi:MAG TPA: sigma-E factor negative regulatory protein [Burkholderiales bacterium]|nr:sigma-E factor negative regulatory protein [Burkholderiales bacterium]